MGDWKLMIAERVATRKLTWRAGMWIVLGALGAGVALSLALTLAHIWLAPPYLTYTFYLYPLVTLIWVPAWLSVAALRPVGERHIPARLLITGVLVSALFWLLSIPALFGSGISPRLDEQCRRAVSDRQVTYTCSNTDALAQTSAFVFTGPEGWPFVRLVDVISSP
jgi:hypothetical protein